MKAYKPFCDHCFYNTTNKLFVCTKAKCECLKDRCPEHNWLMDATDQALKKYVESQKYIPVGLIKNEPIQQNL